MKEPMHLTTSGEDGVDFINIHTDHAQTDLGKELSGPYAYHFIHPILGPFGSVKNFIEWAKSGGTCDEMRFAHEKKLKYLTRVNDQHPIRDFQTVLMDVLYIRIKNDPLLIKKLTESHLPFTLFYIFNESVRIPVPGGKIFVNTLESIRQHLKENKEIKLLTEKDYKRILPKVFHP